MQASFQNKVALVTGSGSGIGRATAMAFAREGARVIVSDVDEVAGRETRDGILKAGGASDFIRCDVSHADEVKSLIEKIVRNCGRLDIACNNAGVEGRAAPTADLDEAMWDTVIGINLKGVWLCLKHELAQMAKQGGGAIVNISSIAGLVGFQGSGAYVASKHGVIGLTKTAALEYAHQGIRVNAISPGVIHTTMIDRVAQGNPQVLGQFDQSTPLGRMGKPEEVASAVLWLCSEGAGFTTGHTLVVDGGWTAQ